MQTIIMIANLVLRLTKTSVSIKQVFAAVSLWALLIPIAAPVPAFAYTITDGKASQASFDLTPPSTPFLTVLAEYGNNALASLLAFINSSTKNKRTNEDSLSKEARERKVKDFQTQLQSDKTIAVGDVLSLSAIPLDKGGSIVNGVAPKWKSGDCEVIKVISDSQAIALKEGITSLTVYSGEIEKEIRLEVKSAKETESSETAVLASQSPQTLVADDDPDVRDSTYSPENNVGEPPNKIELDSPSGAVAARIRHRAGIANYSFDVPFASLPGRGINASIGMMYNSRVWNKTGESPNAFYRFDVDDNWLAPGFTVGYGALRSHFASKIVLLTNNQYKMFNEVVPEGYTDGNGTRHQLECKATAPIPNTQTNLPNTYCTEYGTSDGTFVKVIYYGTRPLSPYLQEDMSAYASTYFTLVHSNGAKITYSVPGAQFTGQDSVRDHYPVLIQNSNGNQINVAYKDNKDTIEYIRDTLGRYIRFYYDPNAVKKLVAVTVPGFNGGGERQTIRFYYDENVSLSYQGRFSGNASGPATIRTLRYVYFPGTGGGYRYDYHANFGMITKITRLTGMTVTGNSLTSTGSVNAGATEAATTQYTYANDGSQTPLTDVPKFNQRTDDWLGRTTSSAAITYYDTPESAPGVDKTSTVTVPQTDFSVSYETVFWNTSDWKNGLTKQTSITKHFGPSQQYTSLMGQTVYSWAEGIPDASGRKTPVMVRAENTNDAGQVKATTFGYDGYNNQNLVKEYDFAAAGTPEEQLTQLRRTEATYETGAGWINNRLIRLPKEIKTIVNNVTVSKIAYEYDNYIGSPLAAAPNVIQHDPTFVPQSGTHDCNCHYVCDPGDFPPHCPMECDQCPNYDTSTDFRGNVTKVTAFSDATLTTDPNANVQTMEYDVTGNVVEASMSCCNIKVTEYSASNQYAYPTKETRGSGTQLITEASYDFNTGLLTTTTDENEQDTTFTYDSTSLMQTRVDFPDGAWVTSEYNLSTYPYNVKTTGNLDSSHSVSSWSYINGRGETFRSRRQTAGGYLSNDIEFDNLGRAVRSFNPYTVSRLTGVRPSGIKFTEVTEIDALGRTLKTTLQDSTTVTLEYSGLVGVLTDQAGKKRRQVGDALGKVIRVDEPDASGNLGTVSSPIQPTYYEYDGNGNLKKITQSNGTTTQERLFKYDALSRLTHEKQVEATPTLNDAGVKVGSGGTWTNFYKYNTQNLLTEKTDARGVKAALVYDGLNRVSTVTYTGESGYQTPTLTYTYDQQHANYYNKGRLTKIETAAVSGSQATPATVQNYDYDKVGQMVNQTQIIGSQTYGLQYGYNLAGQLVTETYPSGKVVTNTVDNYGVIQTIADAQRTYLSASTLNGQGLPSQINLGNGTIETFTFNDRFQLTSQSLTKGSEVLQKYDYSFGQITLSDGSVDATKNNGQMAKVEGYIGSNKQWSQRFAYDELGRLSESREYKGSTSTLSYKQKFDFDRFGNLYRKAANNPTSGQETPLAYTAIEDSDISKSTNRFTSNTTYNDAGQVTADSKFRNMGFAYDGNGRLINATKTNVPDATTVYDGLGNRVATKVNNVWRYMIYDALGKLVAEYGVQSEGYGGVKFIQQDSQGSIRAVTNSNGFVISRTDHQAFGDEIGNGVGLRSVDQGYTGDYVARQGYALTESDEGTGQRHTWFRKLEPGAGRWSSPDPNRRSMNLADPQSINRYNYVDNDPVGKVDPSGLEPMICQIDGIQYNCSTVFGMVNHGPVRISNGDGGSVDIVSYGWNSDTNSWVVTGWAYYSYIFNVTSYMQQNNTPPSTGGDPRTPGGEPPRPPGGGGENPGTVTPTPSNTPDKETVKNKIRANCLTRKKSEAEARLRQKMLLSCGTGAVTQGAAGAVGGGIVGLLGGPFAEATVPLGGATGAVVGGILGCAGGVFVGAITHAVVETVLGEDVDQACEKEANDAFN